MDIQALQALMSVADTGSFSRAAERLHLSQPAISKRIATLEDQIGAALFNRVGRRITLTQAGQALLPHARRVLRDLEDARRALSRVSRQVSGRLSLGTSHHIGLHRLPPVLRHYTKHYPSVDLDLHFMDSEAACESVTHGSLELGIVTLPLHPFPNLSRRTIWTDQLCVVVAPDHPLARVSNQQPSDLAKYPAVLPDERTFTCRLIQEALGAHGVQPSVRMTTNHLETLKMLASIGLGWTILPKTMVDPTLRVLNLPMVAMRRHLGVVWHQRRVRSAAAQALMDLLLNETAEIAPRDTKEIRNAEHA